MTPEKVLMFYHAPLYKNEALFKKFNEGSKKPEEVSVPCMVVDMKANPEKGIIKVKVIN